MVEDKKTLDGLTLKELPKHPCYDFLGGNGTKQIIISAALTEEMEHKLLEVLRRNIGHSHGQLMISRESVPQSTCIRS